MSNQNQNFTLTIPTARIEDVGVFEELRQSAYAEGHDSETLTALAEEVTTTDGRSLYEALASTLAEDDPVIVARRAAEDRAMRLKAATSGSDFYELVFSADDDKVKDIFHRIVLPEDTKATQASKHMADKVGYGPKTNESSFRTSGVVPRR